MFGIKQVMVGAVALTAVGTLAGPTLVSASGIGDGGVQGTRVISQEVDEDGVPHRCGDFAGKRAEMRTERLATVAAALGLEPEAVQAAMESVREQFPRPAFDGERPTREEMEAHRAAMQATLAAALGVTVEDLTAATEQLRGEHDGRFGGEHGGRFGGPGQHFRGRFAGGITGEVS